MQTWDVIVVFTTIPRQPHDKICICIDPAACEVLFINSEAPLGRKARKHAVVIAKHECNALSKDSYLDTTTAIVLPQAEWDVAIADPARFKGPVAPFLKARIQAAISGHNQLTAQQRAMLGVAIDQATIVGNSEP